MIIGVAGFKGCGKGSVAKVLEDIGYVKISAATPLKDMIAFSIPME